MLRTFCKNFNGQKNITLNEAESKHIASVLRANSGDTIEVLNGNGLIGQGKILVANKKAVQIKITDTIKHSLSSPTITLIQASLTNNNTDFLIKEATALGVKNIWIFQAEHSESKIVQKFKSKTEHWEKLTIESCKQSRNPFLPKVNCIHKLQDIPLETDDVLSLFGYIANDSIPLIKCLNLHKTPKNIIIAIGPEGDFSEKEIMYLKNQNFIGCKLGTNILRSEVATLYSVSVINSYFL